MTPLLPLLVRRLNRAAAASLTQRSASSFKRFREIEPEFKRLNPEGYHFAKNEAVVTKKDRNGNCVECTLLDHLVSYNKTGYRRSDKVLLIDPAAAERIADAIQTHSERDDQTLWIDGDGGFCQVSQLLLQRGFFKRAKIAIKDPLLGVLHEHMVTESGGVLEPVPFQECNLNQIAVDRRSNPGLLSPLRLMHQDGVESRPWETVAPPYTLFGSVTTAFASYLIDECIEREQILSEFHGCRPEFFFLVSEEERSQLFRLDSEKATSGVSRMYNVLLRYFFETEHLLDVERSSFVPTRTIRRKSSSTLGDGFSLVRLRPKRDLGLVPHATPAQLAHFVEVVLANRDMRLIVATERELPGVGLDLILKGGVDLYQKVRDTPPEDAVRLFNIFASHKNYLSSTFMAQCEENVRTERFCGTHVKNSEEVDHELIVLRRKYGMDD